MIKSNEKRPNPKDLEKEIGDFLAKKFGERVQLVSPMLLPNQSAQDGAEGSPHPAKGIEFHLKPEDLVAHLDHYIVKQDRAKAVLATKVCTHFNRIKHLAAARDSLWEMVGSVKNNILMIGPTGVGKTYMIKLIAKKLGVPFVKADATKFSETGYVGGDVEDLVRDLVSEADDDISRAQYGIIYIDEIDKIASRPNLIGADVSRTGVQRGLLKPMEETEVELKTPHDPISMIQEIERFRKTGKRERRTVNTKHILFIMSGAFTELAPLIRKRTQRQGIGFGAQFEDPKAQQEILQHVKAEDLIEFGFESEFVGRLPVRVVFENLTEEDLLMILKNPNNPIILGKKLDFAAYGIDIKFEEAALSVLARQAHEENTGARGLVSVIERVLLTYEKKLPSTAISRFPVTAAVVQNPEHELDQQLSGADTSWNDAFDRLRQTEKDSIRAYVQSNRKSLAEKYNFSLTESRANLVATCYSRNVVDVATAVQRIKSCYDEIKKIEMYFFKNNDINIVLEDEAIDFAIEQFVNASTELDDFYARLTRDFKDGLKLIQEKTGRNRFFITKEALINPENFLRNLIHSV